MIAAAKLPPTLESARLDALNRYDILDTPEEAEFDDFTWLASHLCGAPIALISLLDAGRQWFKSRVGLEATETARDLAFCDHAILGTEIMEVSNAQKDDRFYDNPLVTGAPDIRFYAGMPLTTADGFTLGTLCVIDRVPRSLSLEQRGALERLGRQVMATLELRRSLVAQRRIQRRLALEHAVSRILLESTSISLGASRLLHAAGESLGFKVGAIWKVEDKGNALLCLEYWNDEQFCAPEFGKATRELTFARGVGVPGRVWESGRSCWITDVAEHSNFPRARFAVSAGLHACVATPIFCRQKCVGVIELFDTKIARPHEELDKVMQAIGQQFGQFLERKEGEEEIKRTQSALQKCNCELERRNQEIKTFYHTLSHELKTPLTSAREFVSIVIDGLAGPLEPDQLEYLSLAKESCDQLRVYINDLLDVTRMETGKLTVQLKQVSPGRLAERIVQLMHPVAKSKGIDLKAQAEPDLPEASLDENRILQVLGNLLSNALKFTDTGGEVSVEIGRAPKRREFLRVSVRDTGRGIPADQQEQIFDRLYQIKSGDSVTGDGLGLGLYICREVVESHGGNIWVESMAGSGSTFHFELPMSPQARQSKVLVVDDDMGIRTILCAQLELDNFTVTAASGGREALQEMARELPDVVLLDLQMPNMSGADTLIEIRKAWDNVPVILHTGHPDSEAIMRALQESPFKVLAKPCTGAQLLEAVHSAVAFGKPCWNEGLTSRPLRSGNAEYNLS